MKAIENPLQNIDLPVGTKIGFIDSENNCCHICHVLGNYSLRSGEVRTAMSGMTDIDTIVAIGGDSDFIQWQEELLAILDSKADGWRPETEEDIEGLHYVLRSTDWEDMGRASVCWAKTPLTHNSGRSKAYKTYPCIKEKIPRLTKKGYAVREALRKSQAIMGSPWQAFLYVTFGFMERLPKS